MSLPRKSGGFVQRIESNDHCLVLKKKFGGSINTNQAKLPLREIDNIAFDCLSFHHARARHIHRAQRLCGIYPADDLHRVGVLGVENLDDVPSGEASVGVGRLEGGDGEEDEQGEALKETTWCWRFAALQNIREFQPTNTTFVRNSAKKTTPSLNPSCARVSYVNSPAD